VTIARPAPPDGDAPWRPRHAAILALIVLLALAHLLPFLGYLTDDTFIHLQFAKHLLRGDGFSFNAGAPTYGDTSPLWVFLLAGAGAFVPGADATPAGLAAMPSLAVVAKIWGALFTVLAVLGMASAARALGWQPRYALTAAAMVALHAWAARWGISGMETPLALALSAAAFALLARGLIRGRSLVGAGVVLGAGILVRPEFLLLLVLAAAAAARGSAPGARLRRVGSLLVGALITGGSWLALAWSWFHRLLPNTSGAKAGAWLDPERMISAIRESIRIVLAADLIPAALAVLALAWLRPWDALREDRGRRAFWTLALGWILLLIAGYALRGVQVVSRYLVPMAPAVALIGLAALRHASAAWPSRRRAIAPLAMLALYAAQNLGVTLAVSLPHAARHTEGLRASLGEIALWARARSSPGTLFAVADIGVFGYYSDRQVLDLYGLVTPELSAPAAGVGYDAIVFNLLFEPVGRPRYLVDRATRAARLSPPDDPATPYRFLFSRTIPDLGITRQQTYVYSVYAIDWTLYDRLHPRVATASHPVEAEAPMR
jgi:uncharacterized protein YjiS (DUF1127 family)